MPAKKTARRSGRFVCPECGFRAAHAMGLGRHRTARHGVPSRRQALALGSNSALEARVAALERRYERLLRAIERLVQEERSRSGVGRRT
jgi:hypothetical protein